MDLEKLNKNIESNRVYIFMQRHKKAINIIEGIIIILLLISINTYMIKDFSIKKQIAEKCGYTNEQYTCICDKTSVEIWKLIQDNKLEINITDLQK